MATRETEEMFRSQQQLYKLERNFCCPNCKHTIARPDALDMAVEELRATVHSAETADAASSSAMIVTINLMLAATGEVNPDALREPADVFHCPSCRSKLSVLRAWAGQYPAAAKGCALAIAVLLVGAASLGWPLITT